MNLLKVEPLCEIRIKDAPCAPIPEGGLCNGGLCKMNDGWLLTLTNKCTPGRKMVSKKYGAHIIAVLLDENFQLVPNSSELMGFHGGLTGFIQDMRVSHNFSLSACYRKSLGSVFQPCIGMFKADGRHSLVDALSDDFPPALRRYDQKNWVHLSEDVIDLGPLSVLGVSHGLAIFDEPPEGELPKPRLAQFGTSLVGGFAARPSAPGFEWRGERYASYHFHESLPDGGRAYYQQFAKMRDDAVEFASSTPPLRFSQGSEFGIQFLMGAVPVGDDLILSYGVNDEYNVVARASMFDIVKLLQ